jgi:hypothetical protein
MIMIKILTLTITKSKSGQKIQNIHIILNNTSSNAKILDVPLQAWTVSLGCRRLKLPEYLDSQHRKVVRSQSYTPAFTPPRDIPGTHFCQRLS